MDESKLTPVFKPGVKPARRGVYVVHIKASPGFNRWYALWTGRKWNWTSQTPERAVIQTNRSADCCEPMFLGWRGLSENPNA